LKILHAEEPLIISNINLLIYGMPGSGKTSIAFTANKPLSLDFDKGSHRSHNRKDIVQINSWSEVAKLSPADLKPYDTIVIDTLGRCLDYIQQALIEGDSKLARKDGALTMQGYGALKSTFTNWMKQLSLLGKDVIMLAHDKEDKDNDIKIVRPDIVGGSYNEIMKVADFIGYLYLVNEKRQLDFNPCEKYIGKNAAALPKLNIPDFTTEPAYMTKLVTKMKQSLGQISKEQSEAITVINTYIERINKISSADEMNAFIYEKKPDLRNGVAEQLKAHAKTRAKELGLEFHAEEKKYFAAPKTVKPVETIEPQSAAITPATEPAKEPKKYTETKKELDDAPFPEPEPEAILPEEAEEVDDVDEFAKLFG
ncbi:ATP-binding protein, partial [bacterium]|nr:ATP-binding protein [bacterium]